MDSAKGPTEAVARLLAEDLRRLITALPEDLQESAPEHLKGKRPASELSTELKSDAPPPHLKRRPQE
jgi:hypothetical protein